MRGICAFGDAKFMSPDNATRTLGGDRMSRKFVPQAAALLSRRRRIFVVASVTVALAAVVFSIAGSGVGGGNAARVTAGIARASATGSSSSLAATGATAPMAGPQVIDGDFQGESPAVASLPVLPVVQSPIHTREIEALKPAAAQSRHEGPGCPGQEGHGADLGADPELRRHLPAVRRAVRPAKQLQLPSARHERRGRGDAVRPDGEHRLRRFLEVRHVLRGATPINQLWATPTASARRTTTATRWCSTTSWRIAGSCRSSSPRRPTTRSTASASRSRRRATRPARTTSTSSTSAAPSTTTRSSASGLTPTTCPRTSSRTARETSSGAGAIAFERAKMLAGQPARVVYFDESAQQPAWRPVHRRAPGRPRRHDATARRLAEPVRRDRRRDHDPADGRKRRVRHAALEVPRRLGQAGQLDVREQRPAELHAPRPPSSRPRASTATVTASRRRAGPQGLDVLGDRLMFRLATGTSAPTRSLFLNRTVKADARNGIRWYEVRIPKGGATRRSTSRAPTRLTDGLRTRSGAGWAASPRTRRATSRPASAPPARTTSRRCGTPAAPQATRSAR